MSIKPIGVFDSGLGGLTVVRALERIMPSENIVYFGDTGRVPYGTRSSHTIEKYARQDAEFLMKHDVKLIIAACGTVSSVAPNTGIGLPVPYLGVVAPAVKAATEATRNKRIGILGTTATVRSGAYTKLIKDILPDAEIIATDCPLFVPLVESGWISPDDDILTLTVRRYIKDVKAAGVDTLILGCTHYPIIAPVIGREMGGDVALISAGEEAAKAAKAELEKLSLCNDSGCEGSLELYVSDRPEGFSKIAGTFLERNLNEAVEQVSIG
jgi:glutamate racemase